MEKSKETNCKNIETINSQLLQAAFQTLNEPQCEKLSEELKVKVLLLDPFPLFTSDDIRDRYVENFSAIMFSGGDNFWEKKCEEILKSAFKAIDIGKSENRNLKGVYDYLLTTREFVKTKTEKNIYLSCLAALSSIGEFLY